MADSLKIDLRHPLLRGGRLNVSADTRSKTIRNDRKASLRKLLERGEIEVLEALRERRLHVVEIDRAVREGQYAQLLIRARRKAGPMSTAIERAIAQVEQSREPGTALQYRVCGNALIEYFGSDRPLDEVRTEELGAFLNATKAKGRVWESNTRRQYLNTCRKIWKLAGASPAVWGGIEVPKIRKTRVVFLKPAEWRVLIEKNDRLPAAAMLALGCLAGLRVGEISNLRTGVDVDFDRRVVRVQPRGGALAWKPKRDGSTRDVPMNEELIPVLRFHADHYAGEKYFIRLPGKDAPIHVNVLCRWTRRAMERAGLVYGRKEDGYTAHTLRHTFASWLAQRDVQLLKIAALLGDTPEVVASTYAHLTPRDLDRAVGIIDEVIRADRTVREHAIAEVLRA